MALEPLQVRNRADLAEFLADLAARSRRSPDTLPNLTLEAFLDGAAGWVADMDGYYRNRGEQPQTDPTWSLVAQIFAAATVYE